MEKKYSLHDFRQKNKNKNDKRVSYSKTINNITNNNKKYNIIVHTYMYRNRIFITHNKHAGVLLTPEAFQHSYKYKIKNILHVPIHLYIYIAIYVYNM